MPARFVKGQLQAHRLLGLALAAVMYMVCVTGAIAVYYADIERWERPAAPEMTQVDPEAVGRAVAFVRQRITQTGARPTDVFVITPSAEMPRLVVDHEAEVLAFDAMGRYAGPAGHEFTHFLTDLHYALHLPWQVGFVVIGVLGVLLVALIVGGSLALPRMFRDAFTLRLDGGRRLSRVDLHNRLAVWGLPFHLVVAASGAAMGLAVVATTLAGPVLFGGDGTRAMSEMYGDPVALAAEARKAGPPPAAAGAEPQVVAALRTLARERPDNPPIFMTLNQFGTPNEFVSIGAGHPDRLIYSETYRFNSAGGLMGAAGYADGEAGRQVMASMFRVHAGAFGGDLVKLLYLGLGLGLGFICATGVDIWLAKSAARGRANPRIQAAWTTFVWGAPTVVAAAGTLFLLWKVSPIPTYWAGLATLSLCGGLSTPRLTTWLAPLVGGLLTASLPLAHLVRFGADAAAPAALGVNLALVAAAVAMIVLGGWRWSRRGLEASSAPAT